MKLRPYQQTAIDSTAKAIGAGVSNVLLVAPTGSGKSVLIGGICGRALQKNPSTRILVLCSSSHILAQNEDKIKQFAPHVSTGIYCAGLGRKDTTQSVILASRDSLGKNPLVCGQFDGILIDEAHQVAVDLDDSNTMYARIINSQKPKWTVGLTGTPWRLSGGRIWGEDKWFQKITSNIPMETLRREGYLVPYIFPRIQSKIDTSQVQKSSTGDFAINKLAEVSSIDSVIVDCVYEWHRLARDRKVTLFFCVTRAHAKKTAMIIQERTGIEAAYIDGEMIGNERKGFLDDIRRGRYAAICSVGVLTTGFDAPIIDCIVLMRATLSASLFVQMVGRGLRPYNGKSNLLVLDMAGNFDRFGSIETPLIKEQYVSKDKDDEEDLEKNQSEVEPIICPSCQTINSGRARFCKYCLEIFKIKLEETYTDVRRYPVTRVEMKNHITKAGEKAIRIDYSFSLWMYASEYFLVNRGGWHKRVFEKRLSELKNAYVKSITAQIDGKFIKKITDIEFDNEKERSNVLCQLETYSSSLKNSYGFTWK